MVKNQINDRHIWLKSAKELAIYRVIVILESDRYATPMIFFQIHISAPALSCQIGIRTKVLGYGDKPFIRISREITQFRGHKDGCFNPKHPHQSLYGSDVEIGDQLPGTGKDLLKKLPQVMIMDCLAVIGQDRLPLFVLPSDIIINQYLIYQLGIPVPDRYGQPLPSLGRLYLVPVLPLIFLKLNIIQEYKDICPADLFEIAQPGQILGLVNCDDHRQLPRYRSGG